MFHKKLRISNPKLIKQLRFLPCVACGKAPPNDVHHVKTKASGGDDVENNLMPLSRDCHTLLHTVGYSEMCKRYQGVREWLVKMGREDILQRAEKLGKRLE